MSNFYLLTWEEDSDEIAMTEHKTQLEADTEALEWGTYEGAARLTKIKEVYDEKIFEFRDDRGRLAMAVVSADKSKALRCLTMNLVNSGEIVETEQLEIGNPLGFDFGWCGISKESTNE